MQGARRIALLTRAVGVSVALAWFCPAAVATDAGGLATVAVNGTLLVAQSDQPGSKASYAVALEDGDLVPVSGVPADALPLSHFVGRLTLPDSVVSTLAARGDSVGPRTTFSATSGSGAEALRLVDRQSLTLRVSGTPFLTDPARTSTATVHRQFVSAITNKGALGQDDRALLAHVRSAGAYWRGESNGAISRIAVPAKVTRYRTMLSTKDCGLGKDFFDVIQEAAAKFSGIDLSDGSDQLVLFVPPTCSSGGLGGEGTIGDSFASGGALIVSTGTAINGTYAHEAGHNYGFEHANVRSSGSSMEYYGAYDVMGFALGGYNQLTALSTPFRVFQGITDVGEIRDVHLGLMTSVVHASATIRPRSRLTGLRSMRVIDPDTGEALYLDYRSGTGEDFGSFYTAHDVYLKSARGPIRYAPGVTINAARGGSGVDTLVVDEGGHTSLGAGATWTNASGDLRIHIRALTADGADVSVTFTPRTLRASKPVSDGRPEVGKTLTVEHGAWSRRTTFAYSWSADGAPIEDATGKTLALTEAERGTRITVRVTGTRPGFASRTLVSDRTPRVS